MREVYCERTVGPIGDFSEVLAAELLTSEFVALLDHKLPDSISCPVCGTSVQEFNLSTTWSLTKLLRRSRK